MDLSFLSSDIYNTAFVLSSTFMWVLGYFLFKNYKTMMETANICNQTLKVASSLYETYSLPKEFVSPSKHLQKKSEALTWKIPITATAVVVLFAVPVLFMFGISLPHGSGTFVAACCGLAALMSINNDVDERMSYWYLTLSVLAGQRRSRAISIQLEKLQVGDESEADTTLIDKLSQEKQLMEQMVADMLIARQDIEYDVQKDQDDNQGGGGFNGMTLT